MSYKSKFKKDILFGFIVFFKTWGYSAQSFLFVYYPVCGMISRAAANDMYNNFVHVYTDGSKDPITGKTGMALNVEPLPQ